jgi:S-formylglutathione hydrolase FrmB
VLLAVAGLLVAIGPQAGSADCQTAQLECLPTPEECAAGDATGVWLGRYLGSAALCVGTGGTNLLYVGGNALLPCGAIIVADQTVTADDPRFCDDLLFFPETLTFRVQLPSDYATSSRRYPVLYLLPGGGGDENEWFNFINEQRLADRGIIIVSPYNGVSFYADWRDGSINAESLYIETLLPLIDATYRTIPQRSHRAVAGFSQGGLGALAWSARHPDLFSVAGSFSGIADLTMTDPFGDLPLDAQMRAAATYTDPVGPNPAFGDVLGDAVWWHAFNPTDMVTNLRDVSLWIAVGTGLPGPYDTDPLAIAFAGPTETELYIRNQTFARAARDAGIAHRFRVHNGIHDYRYAADELRAWIPFMLSRLGAPDPVSFAHRRVEAAFDVWGWSFAADPGRAPEFLDVTDASSGGVTLTGSGLTKILTAPYFAPGATVALSGATTAGVVADSEGRISFSVNLGPAHTAQQYTPLAIAAELLGNYFTTKVVTFTP